MDFNFRLTDRNEARAQAGIWAESEVELCDWIEEQCFALRDYFLRSPVVIPLYQSRIRKLIHLQALAQLEQCSQPMDDRSIALSAYSGNLVGLTEVFPVLKAYNAELSGLRQTMAQTLNPGEVSLLAWDICRLDYAYMLAFISATETVEAQEGRVNAAEALDHGEAIFLLEQSTEKALVLLSREKKRIESLIPLLKGKENEH